MINITNKVNCTGCYACKNICPHKCITMESDSEGFLYPKVNIDRCIDCGLCEKVCPIINKIEIKNNPKAYACYNKDEKVRLESSSGGLFSLIAEQIINNNGIVFGVKFDDEFNAVHDCVEVKNEIDKFRGSKYVQSRIGDTYKKAKDVLLNGRQVLFTGTPCQISGLKSYLQKDYDNLFCIDIVCHGVPSLAVWKKYVDFREIISGSKAQKIALRCKNDGWKRYSVSFIFKNNTEYQEPLTKDLYMKVFLNDICLRPSCYSCEFKTLNRQSDITLADFWGVHNMLPEMDDDKGTSLIFVNSDKGQSMVEKIKEDILYKEVDINQAVKYNPAAIMSVKYNPKRDRFFDDIDNFSFDKLVKKFCEDSSFIKIKKKSMSMLKKILK